MLDAPQHLPYVIELAQAVRFGIEDTVVNHPEVLGLGVDVDARDHADAPDDALFVAAPLLARYLDRRPEALLEHSIVEDQVRLRVRLQNRLDLLEEHKRGVSFSPFKYRFMVSWLHF